MTIQNQIRTTQNQIRTTQNQTITLRPDRTTNLSPYKLNQKALWLGIISKKIIKIHCKI